MGRQGDDAGWEGARKGGWGGEGRLGIEGGGGAAPLSSSLDSLPPSPPLS